MEYFLFFIASLANLFLLGFQSQMIRDMNVPIVFVNCWMLAIVQFWSTTWIINLDNKTLSFFCFAGGSSIGVVGSIYFYRWFLKRKKR